MTRPTAMAPDASTSPVGHTPGPWGCQPVERDGPDRGVTIIGLRLDSDGTPLDSPTNGLVGAALPWPTEIDSGDMSRVEANARLMAAAPELLEALECMVATYADMQDGNGDPCPDVIAARAAIAKAQGEQA